MARTDVIAELTGDHREVENLFRRLETGDHTPAETGDLVDEIIMELVRHSVAEESYLYPAVRANVTGGNMLADKELADHARVDQVMRRLDGMRPGDTGFTGALAELMLEVREHVRDEENDLFPRLVAACTPDELDRLGHRVRVMKRVAPTRPRAGLPDRPPMSKVVSAPAGLVDRVRDALTGRGH